jgi:four helix bundle protein
MRDHTKLKVFALADELVLAVYKATAGFPISEQYGLQSQVRRAAVSIAANIVEGCARTTQAEYIRFMEIAYGSARELQYEISLCARLGLLTVAAKPTLHEQCTATAKALNGLLRAIRSHRDN